MSKLTEIQTIRHENVRSLIRGLGKGGASKFAERIGKKPTHTSQFAGPNPSRGISESMARLIEEEFGLARFSLDKSLHKESKNLEQVVRYRNEIMHNSDTLDHGKLLNAAKWARQIEVLFNRTLSPLEHAQLVIDLYEKGEMDFKSSRMSEIFEQDDSGRALLVEAGLMAHKVLQSVKNETTLPLSPKEEGEIYGKILDDVYKEFIETGKLSELAPETYLQTG